MHGIHYALLTQAAMNSFGMSAFQENRKSAASTVRALKILYDPSVMKMEQESYYILMIMTWNTP